MREKKRVSRDTNIFLLLLPSDRNGQGVVGGPKLELRAEAQVSQLAAVDFAIAKKGGQRTSGLSRRKKKEKIGTQNGERYVVVVVVVVVRTRG
jgi:hypothetical protein